jgi:hypothetical protein
MVILSQGSRESEAIDKSNLVSDGPDWPVLSLGVKNPPALSTDELDSNSVNPYIFTKNPQYIIGVKVKIFILSFIDPLILLLDGQFKFPVGNSVESTGI